MPKTREQIRAGHAWAVVTGWGAGADRSDCESLPAMLVTNGLLATWAFLCAKKQDLANALLAYLQQPNTAPDIRQMAANHTDAKHAYQAWILDANLDLRGLTDEVIAYSVWLKRAAEILIPRGDA